MTEYKIKLAVGGVETYRVNADSEDEAIAYALTGDGELIESDIDQAAFVDLEVVKDEQ